MWGEEDNQFGLGVAAGLAFEKRAQAGNVAKDWNLAVGRGFAVLHQSADDDGLAVWSNNDGVGGAFINDRRENGITARGNRNGFCGKVGDLGRDNHFNQTIGGDKRGDTQNDADILILNGVDLIAERVVTAVSDEGNFLSNR